LSQSSDDEEEDENDDGGEPPAATKPQHLVQSKAQGPGQIVVDYMLIVECTDPFKGTNYTGFLVEYDPDYVPTNKTEGPYCVYWYYDDMPQYKQQPIEQWHGWDESQSGAMDGIKHMLIDYDAVWLRKEAQVNVDGGVDGNGSDDDSTIDESFVPLSSWRAIAIWRLPSLLLRPR
jgi:hypothetical protein